MSTEAMDPTSAQDVIESLRSGVPPKRFVSSYAVGNEQFLQDVRRRHLETPSTRGKIRFISGSWGAGKTHVLRLLREQAFDAGYLVATVELSADQTPFNQFEQVFFEIVRNVCSPEMYREGDLQDAAPFAGVLRRALLGDSASTSVQVPAERLTAMKERLFADASIDIDFRRLVANFWETFLPDSGDQVSLEDTRGRLLQWFSGEGGITSFHGPYKVQKLIERSNARLMLQSLSRFTRHTGYRGLVVLLDEAEMAYSVMRKSNLKQAHNNLLHLINSIDECEGTLLVYAATPDFFIDERHGIVIYGALAQRIGQPRFQPPKALDRIWNLDALQTTPNDYLTAAGNIRQLYLIADPGSAETLIDDADLRSRVAELVRIHPEFSHVSTWRVVVTGTVKELDRSAEGDDAQPTEHLHRDIMDQLREQ